MKNDATKSRKKTVIVIIISVIALMVVAAGVFLFLNPPFSDDKDTEKSSSKSSVSDTLETQSADDEEDLSSASSKKKASKKSSPAGSLPEEDENVSDVSSEESSPNAKTSSLETTTEVVRPEKVTERYSFKKVFEMPEPQKDVFYDGTNGNSLPYSLFLPQDYDPANKYPVILFLHGAGEIGSDNTKQLYNLSKMFTYNGDLISTAFVLCPQSNEWWNLDRSSWSDRRGTLSSAMNLLKEVMNIYSCDGNRVYVMGLSMGGYATWDLLQYHGSTFAAGIPICGGGDSFSGIPFKDIPIRIYHGTVDTTVPFSASQDMYNAILRAGGRKAELIKLEGIGHDAWNFAFTDRDTFSWLFAQNKASNPTCEYEYRVYFAVKDSNGKTIISDKDVLDVSDEPEYGDEYTVAVHLHLNESGKRKLGEAYTSSGGKPFTVYWGNQKLYSFTATEPPVDNIFCINKVFDYDNFFNFCDMVTRMNRTS